MRIAMGKFVAISMNREYVDDRKCELKQALTQHYKALMHKVHDTQRAQFPGAHASGYIG